MRTHSTVVGLIAATALIAGSGIVAASLSAASPGASTTPSVSILGDQPTPPRVDRFVGPQASIPWSFAPSVKAVRKATGLPVVRSGKGTAQLEDANFATVSFRVPGFEVTSAGISEVAAGIASAPTMRDLLRQYRQSGWKVVKRQGWNVVMIVQYDFNPGITEVIALHPAHGYVATGQCLWQDETQAGRVDQRKLIRCANSVARLVVTRPV